MTISTIDMAAGFSAAGMYCTSAVFLADSSASTRAVSSSLAAIFHVSALGAATWAYWEATTSLERRVAKKIICLSAVSAVASMILQAITITEYQIELLNRQVHFCSGDSNGN